MNGDIGALKASSHASSAETALGDLPETIRHSIEDEIVGWISKSKAAPRIGAKHRKKNIPSGLKMSSLLYNIVAELVQEQRWAVGPEIDRDERDLVRSVGTFDDLLSCPCTVLVNADHRKMRSYTFKHGDARVRGRLFEQLLNDLEQTNMGSLIRRTAKSVTEVREMLTVFPSQSDARSTISPSKKSDATSSISSIVQEPESSLLRSSRSFEASQRRGLVRSAATGIVV